MLDTTVELPEKLKSHDDDHAEHSRGGGDWCSMSMHRNGKYCMHKMQISYIYTRYREEKGCFSYWSLLWFLLVKVIHVWRRRRVQQLNSTEEELCREWRWHTEHKKQKTRRRKWCEQKGNEVDRATKCSRTVMSLVSHFWASYHCNKFR